MHYICHLLCQRQREKRKRELLSYQSAGGSVNSRRPCLSLSPGSPWTTSLPVAAGCSRGGSSRTQRRVPTGTTLRHLDDDITRNAKTPTKCSTLEKCRLAYQAALFNDKIKVLGAHLDREKWRSGGVDQLPRCLRAIVLVVRWLRASREGPLEINYGCNAKSCKICCIFYYLHVKGHKSSSVKSAIKK